MKNKITILFIGSKRERGKKELESIGVKIISPPQNYSKIKKVRFLFNILKTKKPNAILTDISGIVGLIIIFLSKTYNIPFFVFLRGDTEREIKESIFEKNILYKSLLIIQLKAYYITLNNSNAIFTVSNYLKNRVIKHTKNKNIYKIGISVDINKFNPNMDNNNFIIKNNIKKGDIVLISVTNFNYYQKTQGLNYFLDPIIKILNEDEHIKYIILGDGKYKNIIENKIKEKSKNNNIKLIGYLNETRYAYSSSDIFIHISFLDTASLVILEANASGKCSLINNHGGMKELVINGKTGFIVGERDKNEFERKLKYLITNKELRNNMGLEARKYVVNNHTYKTNGIKLYNLIRHHIKQFYNI